MKKNNKQIKKQKNKECKIFKIILQNNNIVKNKKFIFNHKLIQMEELENYSKKQLEENMIMIGIDIK